MSAQPATAQLRYGATAANVVGPSRVLLVQAALALSSLAVIGYLIIRPGPGRGDLSYASLAASRDAAWQGRLVTTIGYGIAGFSLALAACLLVRRRGASWATIGAALVTVGGVLFAGVEYAIGVLGWYATATEAVPAPTGTSLMAYVEHNMAHLAVADALGFLLLTLGTLLICVALWRSRAVPRWLPAFMAAATLAQFAPVTERLLDVVQIAVMSGCLAVAWFAGRPVAHANAPDATL
jgi:hypothetical protein